MLINFKFLLPFLCIAQAASTKCPGGYNEGETVEKGSYWYNCKDGQLIMKGCLTDRKTHMNERDTYKKGGYLIECASAGSEFTLRYKGCVSEKDEEVTPGGTWQDDSFWYMCVSDGDRVKSEIKGCVDEGKRYGVSLL